MAFQLIKVQITNLLIIAKPALELLNEHLNVAADRGVKASTVHLTVLFKPPWRLEIAVLGAGMKKVAGFLYARAHILPVSKAGTQDIFSAAYVFLLNAVSFLFAKAVKYFEHTAIGKIALNIKRHAFRFSLTVYSILRVILGEENLASIIHHLNALLRRVFNHLKGVVENRVYVPCKERVNRTQKVSPFFTIVCRISLCFLSFVILAMSVIFAFLFAYALDEISLEVAIEENNLAFIVNLEKLDDPCDTSGVDTTIAYYGCNAKDYTEAPYVIDHAYFNDIMLEGVDADVEDNIEQNFLNDYEEEWEREEVGKKTLEAKAVETDAVPTIRITDTNSDSEQLRINCSDNLVSVVVSEILSHSNNFLVDALEKDGNADERVEGKATRMTDEENIMFNDHKIVEASCHVAEETSYFRRFEFCGGDVGRDTAIPEVPHIPPIGKTVADNIIAAAAARFIDGITVEAGDENFVDETTAYGAWWLTLPATFHEVLVDRGGVDPKIFYGMNIPPYAPAPAPLAPADPPSNDESVSTVTSTPEPGTLVRVGLAHEGHIFSDNQDLEDIKEMEVDYYVTLVNK